MAIAFGYPPSGRSSHPATSISIALSCLGGKPATAESAAWPLLHPRRTPTQVIEWAVRLYSLAEVDRAQQAPAPTVEEAYDLATRRSHKSARASNRVLILFSGAYARPDGMAAFLKKYGLEAVLVDNDPARGDPNHDIMDDAFFRKLLDRVRSGEFRAILAAPPCSTFSISRFYRRDGAPEPVRDRSHIYGLPGLSAAQKREVNLATAVAVVATPKG